MIRHLTSIDNVCDGQVVNPFKVKHGIITALKISQLSGWVDPLTHLNADFPQHALRFVNVVDDLNVGSEVVLENEHFMSVHVSPCKYKSLGDVDEFDRMENLKQIYHNDIKTNNIILR